MTRISKSQAAGLLITGAVVGAAVALLYAPKSGAQTRKDIRKFSQKAVNRLDDLQDGIRERVSGWVGDVSDVFGNAKKYVEDGKNRLHRMIQSA